MGNVLIMIIDVMIFVQSKMQLKQKTKYKTESLQLDFAYAQMCKKLALFAH